VEVTIVAMLRFTRISPLWCLRDRLAQVSGDHSLSHSKGEREGGSERERKRERGEVGEKEERVAGLCVRVGGERKQPVTRDFLLRRREK